MCVEAHRQVTMKVFYQNSQEDKEDNNNQRNNWNNNWNNWNNNNQKQQQQPEATLTADSHGQTPWVSLFHESQSLEPSQGRCVFLESPHPSLRQSPWPRLVRS